MWYFISFVAGIIVASIVVFAICNRRTDRANSNAAALKSELSDSRNEVERARTTLANIRRTQSELTDGLGENNKELRTVIERLQVIRDKVHTIEVELSNYYSGDYGSNSNNLQGNN